MILKRLLSIILLVIPIISFVQCTDNEEHIQELYFVGDSHITRWDLGYYFPNYITHNMGVAGSGIEYIESCQGVFSGKNIVVMSGINDIGLIGTKYTANSYAKRYADAIEKLQGKCVFVYSILPTDMVEGEWSISFLKLVAEVNTEIEAELKQSEANVIYINAYKDMNKNGSLNPEYSSDGIHLNDYGYEVLTERIQEKL